MRDFKMVVLLRDNKNIKTCIIKKHTHNSFSYIFTQIPPFDFVLLTRVPLVMKLQERVKQRR